MKAVIAVPALGLMILRAYRKNSLTIGGLIAATITGIAHAVHPWNLPFVLLCIFFLAGTRVTHIKKDVKAKLTIASKGSPGGEGPRNHNQVLANSLAASLLSLLHAYQLRQRHLASANESTRLATAASFAPPILCFSWAGDLLVVGIIANYAAVTADTFSSELGILSRSSPRLITSPTFRKVPPGTNGGVTFTGLAAGLLGSALITVTAFFFAPFCNDATLRRWGGGTPWTQLQFRTFLLAMTIWGFLGSVLDSVLGAVLQRSVRDARTGKIIEGEGGDRVLITPGGFARLQSAQMGAAKLTEDGKDTVRESAAGADGRKPSRVVESGYDLLDNNHINLLMAFTMSFGAMAVAGWYWEVPLQSLAAIFKT